MRVYHWTSEINKELILEKGLRRWSFVCRNEADWYGDVCLAIDLPYEIDWDKRDEHAQWQAIVKEVIDPLRIVVWEALDGREVVRGFAG